MANLVAREVESKSFFYSTMVSTFIIFLTERIYKIGNLMRGEPGFSTRRNGMIDRLTPLGAIPPRSNEGRLGDLAKGFQFTFSRYLT